MEFIRVKNKYKIEANKALTLSPHQFGGEFCRLLFRPNSHQNVCSDITEVQVQ